MAYLTYTTDAIVCGSYDHNTSDRSYLLFTREAGMLFATARSVREERSKQRCALQDFSLIRVSLVKGKQGWKIGSVEAKDNTYYSARTREHRKEVAHIVKMLRRFLKGEEAHPELYDDAVKALRYLLQEDSKHEQVRDIYTLRLLHQLGYVSVRPSYRSLIESDDPWRDIDRREERIDVGEEARDAVQHALHVSHL